MTLPTLVPTVTGGLGFPWSPRAIIIHDHPGVGCACAAGVAGVSGTAPGWGVGACCAACAEGKPCGGGVGWNPFGVERGRPWSDAVTLAGAIDRFQNDVSAWADKQPSMPAFLTDWNQFTADWKTWFNDQGSLVQAVGIVGDHLIAFETLERRYNQLLDAGKKAGVGSIEKASDGTSPFEKGVTEGAKDVGSGVVTWAPWVAGGAILLLAGPSIAGAIARKVATK